MSLIKTVEQFIIMTSGSSMSVYQVISMETEVVSMAWS